MPPQTVDKPMFGKAFARRKAAGKRAESLEALHAHAGLVIGSAGRVLGSLADAEDIAQDIAEKLLRSPPDAVESWPALLKTMAVNGALDRLRKRRDGSGLPDPEPVAGPETLVSDHQRAEALRAAIAALPERDGRLFSHYYFGDLSQVEIAGQLGMTPNAVGVAIHRLRERLTKDVRERLGLTDTGDTEQ